MISSIKIQYVSRPLSILKNYKHLLTSTINRLSKPFLFKLTNNLLTIRNKIYERKIQLLTFDFLMYESYVCKLALISFPLSKISSSQCFIKSISNKKSQTKKHFQNIMKFDKTKSLRINLQKNWGKK